jgi:formylglycine-generating enzyme required for sulfatase activity
MAGNVWEWTVASFSRAKAVARGGAYYHDKMASRSTNRLLPESTLRDLTLGLRICADLKPDRTNP